MSAAISTKRNQLTEVIRFISSKGWSAGTGGNYSVVLDNQPLTLLMSPSSVDKGSIKPEDLIIINQDGTLKEGAGKPSAETLIHLVLAKKFGAKAILHTHSIYNTLWSRKIAPFECVTLDGFEMLKALGTTTHETQIKIPVFPNTQDIQCFSEMLDEEYEKFSWMKGFLMAGHGLYTWGDSIASAKRHVEALEFLFEIT